MELFTDASNLGYGAYWAGRFFNCHWNPEETAFTIAWKELYAILVACSTWGHLWPRKRILFHCDNAAVVTIWGKGSCKCPNLMSMVHHLFLLAARGKTGSSSGSPPPGQDPHPCAVNGPLTACLQTLQLLSVAPSTRRTYQAGIARLSEFCTRFNLCSLPASPLTLRYFCAHLSTSVRHSTINIYLSAIRFDHIQHEFPDPTQDVLLRYIVKGIKRTQVKKLHPKVAHHRSGVESTENIAAQGSTVFVP